MPNHCRKTFLSTRSSISGTRVTFSRRIPSYINYSISDILITSYINEGIASIISLSNNYLFYGIYSPFDNLFSTYNSRFITSIQPAFIQPAFIQSAFIQSAFYCKKVDAVNSVRTNIYFDDIILDTMSVILIYCINLILNRYYIFQ